jgi:hypothetical protein
MLAGLNNTVRKFGDSTGVIRRFYRSNQRILQEYSEDSTGVIRRFYRSNQKILQE